MAAGFFTIVKAVILGFFLSFLRLDFSLKRFEHTSQVMWKGMGDIASGYLL